MSCRQRSSGIQKRSPSAGKEEGMARPVFKHQDDDGDLSIFTSSDVVLIVCEHGHYWSLHAKEHSTEGTKL